MFRNLRRELFENQVTQATLSKAIGKSKTYITNRITGRVPFDMADVYGICDYLRLPYGKIAEYFPKNGADGERKST